MGDDGYLQSKQRELLEQLKDAEQKMGIIDKKLEHIDSIIEEYNLLIDNLKKFEDYKKNITKEVVEEFGQRFERFLELNKDFFKKTVKDSLSCYKKSVDDLVSIMKKLLSDYEKEIDVIHNDMIRYTGGFSELVNILTEKKIISFEQGKKIMEDALNISKDFKKELKKLSRREKGMIDQLFKTLEK